VFRLIIHELAVCREMATSSAHFLHETKAHRRSVAVLVDALQNPVHVYGRDDDSLQGLDLVFRSSRGFGNVL